ncbi:hypothetical protein NDU88_004812 [Pleurodeles waltl]|uniref:Uncharacterized protein n=1 Tax=Pleurodeles waltl TaxID=8319 RepID=A0AAV7QD13_PLEWA|nr:hypothetical protein NDU88_004812 [Pleurodeles waltl]
MAAWAGEPFNDWRGTRDSPGTTSSHMERVHHGHDWVCTGAWSDPGVERQPGSAGSATVECRPAASQRRVRGQQWGLHATFCLTLRWRPEAERKGVCGGAPLEAMARAQHGKPRSPATHGQAVWEGHDVSGAPGRRRRREVLTQARGYGSKRQDVGIPIMEC